MFKSMPKAGFWKKTEQKSFLELKPSTCLYSEWLEFHCELKDRTPCWLFSTQRSGHWGQGLSRNLMWYISWKRAPVHPQFQESLREQTPVCLSPQGHAILVYQPWADPYHLCHKSLVPVQCPDRSHPRNQTKLPSSVRKVSINSHSFSVWVSTLLHPLAATMITKPRFPRSELAFLLPLVHSQADINTSDHLGPFIPRQIRCFCAKPPRGRQSSALPCPSLPPRDRFGHAGRNRKFLL